MSPFVLLFALALLAALTWLGLLRSAQGTRSSPLDAGLAALAGGLLVSRAVFVVAHWSYFSVRPAESLWFWQGGLSGFGAAVGAIVGLGLYAALSDGQFWHLADRLILPVTLLVFAAWLGCLLEGCAYGLRLESPTWVPASPDLTGTGAPRWPTQSVGALTSLVGLLALLRLQARNWRTGALFAAGLAFHGAVALLLSLTRADPVPSVIGLRGDAAGAATLALAGLAVLLLRRSTGPRSRDGQADSRPGPDEHPAR